MRTFLLGLALTAALQAQDLDITVDGKPFTTFHYGADANKPYLAPLRSPSGKIMTRGFPMENIPGESHDHLHHRGLWFSYDDVNGVKFWENDPSYVGTKPNIGKIVVQQAALTKDTLTAKMEWRDPSGKVLLVEDRIMRFSSDLQTRTIDFNITLTAAVDVTFGDTKEGAFAIRLCDAFTAKNGVKILDADGRTSMANVWGKRSNWVDYSGELEGENSAWRCSTIPGIPSTRRAGMPAISGCSRSILSASTLSIRSCPWPRPSCPPAKSSTFAGEW